MNRKFLAFSLIEIAIVLIIIGLIGGMALPTLKWMLEWQKAATTAQHQEQILYALANYTTQNKMLPYAANPGIHLGKQEIGRRRGIVPYADLGLPESMAKDGYHRWFTYVVDDYYAVLPRSRICGATSSSKPVVNRLCDKLEHPNSLKVKGKQDKIAIALISHGPQGRGAYPNPLAVPPKGEDEMQNATSDTEIIDRPLSQRLPNPFSHTVAWVTAENLLAMYAHAPCPPVDVTPQSTQSPHSRNTEIAPRMASGTSSSGTSSGTSSGISRGNSFTPFGGPSNPPTANPP